MPAREDSYQEQFNRLPGDLQRSLMRLMAVEEGDMRGARGGRGRRTQGVDRVAGGDRQDDLFARAARDAEGAEKPFKD